MSYGWSARRSVPAVRAQVEAALRDAKRTGWDGLAVAQRAYLDDFWDRADVELEGDAELQQAIRFALFHTLQAGARAEQRPIPAKGLTGPGYDGHTFWDTEAYVLPVLTYTTPEAVADALRWRHTTLVAGAAGEDARARGRGLPLAHDQRRGVLGLLACRDGGVPRGRGHRRRGEPVSGGDARRDLCARGRHRAAGRDRSPLGVAGPPRPSRTLPHRRRHRPRRVHRRGRQQRVHEPRRRPQP